MRTHSEPVETTPLICIRNIQKTFAVGDEPVVALADISLHVQEGEFIAILGRSGSGKSTLMGVLGLLERPDAGAYLLGGRDVQSLDEDARTSIRSREIGFIFQLPVLLPRSTAIENVELPLAYAGVPRRDRRDRAEIALERVGLSNRMKHWPTQLSGGEQQRVAIARALVHRPALILADEPTGSLDSGNENEILSMFDAINRDGHTVIVVTHAAEVAERARRLIVLHDGRVLEDKLSTTNPLSSASS